MALILDESKKAREISVISSKDASVTCSREDYKRYIDTFDEEEPDESLLKLSGEPTRFIITTSLEYAKTTNLQRKELRVVDGKTEVSGTYLAEEFRLSFKDVLNPPGTPKNEMIKFKKAGGGGAMESFLDSLKRSKILTELMSAWILGRKYEESLEEGELSSEDEKKI